MNRSDKSPVMSQEQSKISNQKSKIVSPHPAFKLRHTLRGHTDTVYRMALSPDGRYLASPSEDTTVHLWDMDSGEPLCTLRHDEGVACVAWSPDGQTLASGTNKKINSVTFWNMESGQRRQVLQGHTNMINSVAWSPDGQILASCSDDNTIRLWNATTGQLRQELKRHTNSVEGIAWSPDGRRLCSGSSDETIRLWEVATGQELQILSGHKAPVTSIAWSPDGQYIVSGSTDRTIRIWYATTGRPAYVLEGHIANVVSVAFLDGGRLLASLGITGQVIIWWTNTWEKLANVEQIGTTIYSLSNISNLATHPILPMLAVPGKYSLAINIWEIDFALLLGAVNSTVHYVNAKAVLLGESGVGKSGLGIRLAEKEFRTTESTHGAQFWHLPMQDVPGLPDNLQAELTLWDLAGQPEYRLIHQLFLDDTDAALLLFDCSDPNDPFRGVPYWAKVLKKHVPKHAVKFLISARCDVSPVTVDRLHINQTLAQYGLHEYLKTSAKQGEGVEQLFQRLLESIPWQQLPRTSTPELFEVIRAYLLEVKEAGETLIPIEVIHTEVTKRYTERQVSAAEIDTVIALQQSRGLVYRLEPRPQLTLILLQPELLNQYASSVIQAARNHPQGIGAVTERNVLIGDIPITGFERLPRSQESLLLEATVELLITHDLGFREMGMLVFPSQINVTRPAPPETHPRTEVAYRFSGGIETIYASLVVRLSYTDYFRRVDQWKYAVEFARQEARLGFAMQQIEEGTGELEIYFDPGISEFDRVTFIRFITDHLRAKGVDIQEEIRLYCPNAICGKEVEDRKAIAARIAEGFLDIPCQYCKTDILIPQSIEERYQRDQQLIRKQTQLTERVEERTKQEVKQFRNDQELRRPAMETTLRQELISFFVARPCFENENGRKAILLTAGLDAILPQIELSGSASEFVPLVVDRLERYGTLTDQDLPLIRLLDAVAGQVGQNHQATIQAWCDRLRAQALQPVVAVEEHRIHLLHLSDLHLMDEQQAQVYRTQLETDLIRELELRHLDYIVLSGDIANYATAEEYRAAFAFLDGLVKRFGLDASRVLIVPGNHDLNWDTSEAAYQFTPKRKLPATLPEGKFIPAGDSGALLRDDTLYQQRFANFNAEFYRRVYAGVQDYPADAGQQAQIIERPDDRLLFLGLNSCWEVDHHFTRRTSINMAALTAVLDRLQDGKYDGWLKIAVWHHPVTGQEMMNDEFLQLLTVHGFQICLHGHIHEALEGFHKYDDARGLHLIGAGTFGVPTREQVTGIPLQYNLLVFDRDARELVVHTRKKEKPNGAWSADARWGKKNEPKPWYKIQL